jgi:mannose-6-phosphate isomerase-like protein (cupin superfamily)
MRTESILENAKNSKGEILASTEQTRHKLATLSANLKPTVFTVRSRALKGGSTDTIVAATPNQWVQIKCYASGGENTLHAHTHEDHTFIVLQGEAAFTGPFGESVKLESTWALRLPREISMRST